MIEIHHPCGRKFLCPWAALSAAALLSLAAGARAENWPQWRGPFFNGSTTETNLPATWSTTENVVWKTKMPSFGMSTPIVWGGRVFATAVDEPTRTCLAMCLDAGTGKVLWSRPASKDRRFMGGKQNAASPSPVTDGKTVWFLYGSGDLVAFDMDGEKLWSRQLEKDYGRFIIKWGYGGSPLLLDGKLYVVVMQNEKPGRYGTHSDGGKDTRTGKLESFLLGLDAKTGKTLWKQIRRLPDDMNDEGPESYTTPVPYTGDGRSEIILHSGEFVTSHSAETGREFWRWEYSPHSREVWQRTVSSPTPGKDAIYVARPRSQATYALRPAGGTGLLDDGIMAWRVEEGACDAPTCLLYQGRLYVLSGKNKSITCIASASGKVLWSERLGVDFRASPTGADGKIYCMAMSGKVFVLQAGDAFKRLAEIPMAERTNQCFSTISAANGRLFIRTPDYLYCIGKK